MRGVSSFLFRCFNQDKSLVFQESTRASGACRPVDFGGLRRTIVSLPPPCLSRSCGSAHVDANSGASWVEATSGIAGRLVLIIFVSLRYKL